MGTNVGPVCGDDKTYLEKIAGGGVTPRYLGTYQTLAALKADWPDSMGDSMKDSWAMVAGTQYTYSAGAGWGIQVSFNVHDAIGENLFTGLAVGASGKYLDDSGQQVANGNYFISAPLSVSPGERIIIGANGGRSLQGGWFLNGVWVAPIDYDDPNGVAYGQIVPNGVNQICVNYASYEKKATYIHKPSFEIKKKLTSISAVGTSITLGLDRWNSAGHVQTYWEIAGKSLGIETLRGYGISGGTASAIASNMANVLESDVVSVEVGYNDWSTSVPIGAISDTANSTFYGCLDIIAKYMLANFSRSILVFCTAPRPASYLQNNAVGITISAYADAVVAVARKYGIKLCDFYYTQSMGPYTQLALTQDGIHPNYWGYYVLANVWIKSLY